MFVSLGQYTLNIAADDKFAEVLPRLFGDYLCSSADACVQGEVKLEAGLSALQESDCDGWNCHFCEGYREAVYRKEGDGLFSLRYGFSADGITVCVPENHAYHIRPGIMYGILLALHSDCIGLHGVTVQCGGKTVILSAPSGTGKSTLAELLVFYGGARVVNGDFAMLSSSEEGVMFEPTPFCGSSGVCRNERVRIDQIVFLGQSEDNSWHDLAGRQAVQAFLNNVFIPDWDDEIRDDMIVNALKVLSRVKTSYFSFAPGRMAAEEFFRKLMQTELSAQTSMEVNRMDINSIPIPTSKEEMDEIRNMIRSEVAEDDLDQVAGGNDDVQGKSAPTPWICPFCGATIMVRQFHDGPKHMTKCPSNPYK